MNCEHCGTVFEPRREHGRARAIAMISEAVWWVTIVDGTLVRYHPSVYDAVLAGHLPAELRQIEGILAGLRFVRDQMGHDIDHADFIHRQPSRSDLGERRVAAWKWTSVPEPALTPLPPCGQAWEITRYRSYETHLAHHTIGETFGRAAAFIKQAAAKATSVSRASARAR